MPTFELNIDQRDIDSRVQSHHLNKKVESRYSIIILKDGAIIARGLTSFNLSSHLGKVELDIEVTNHDMMLIPAVELSQMTNQKFYLEVEDRILQKTVEYVDITLESMSFDQHPQNPVDNFARTVRVQQLRFRQIDDRLYRAPGQQSADLLPTQPRLHP